MNTKNLIHRSLYSRILIFAVSLLGGLILTLGLLWLLGGEATPSAAAPVPNKSPGPSKDMVEKPMYLPLQASGWTTGTPITIYNPGLAVLADFQISLTIPYAAGMRTDYGDLRFRDADGNDSSYWVETYTVGTEASVWVKVPSIPTPTTTISMYYGNSSASSASNGEDTFEFFDDFEGTSLDGTRWDASSASTYRIENGYLKMWGNWGGECGLSNPYPNRINTRATFANPFAVESRFKIAGSDSTPDQCRICYYTTFGNRDVIGVDHAAYGFGFRIQNSSNRQAYNYSFPDVGIWHRITKIFEPYTLTVRSDYAPEYSYSPGPAVLSSGSIGLSGDTDMGEDQRSDQVDWIAIRKYASQAPTTTLGSPTPVPDLVVTKSATPEEANAGMPITYTIVFTNTGAIAATNVVISDHVPVSVLNPTEVLSNCSMGASAIERGGTPFVWDVANLQIDEVCVITITGQISIALPAGHIITNKVTATAAEDEYLGNNSDAVAVSYQTAGWTEMQPITIYNSSTSVLVDYQISLTIPYTAGMQADFGDLRFGDADGNCLNYWIETYTPSGEAIVWVKIPSIPTPTTTISMYYGNSSVSSASNGEDTFEFFDDFEGTSLDTTKWNPTIQPPSSGTWSPQYSVGNGYLKMWGEWGGYCSASGVYARINTQASFSKPFAVESRFMVGGTSDQLSGCCNICYHTIFGNSDVIGIGNDQYGSVFRRATSYTSNSGDFPDQYEWHRITKSFEQNRLVVRTDYGLARI